jgi:glycosyltransferase involved in cell wall biosynthesis
MRLLFLDNSTQLESIHDLKSRARGGMVSSLFTLPDQLSQMGHRVHVYADIRYDGYTDAGVCWHSIGALNADCIWEPCDFLICNRGVGDGYPQIKAKHRILWTHDLPHNGFIPDPKIMGAFDATVFMSQYAERVWRTFYKTIGKSFLIPNGVDRAIFHPTGKIPSYLIYASAPNRGLKRLPLIFEAIQSRANKPVSMTAFSNLAAQHPNECRDGMDDGFQEVYKTVQESDVELVNPVPQEELARELGTAGLMILPTDYPEICSNIILQSLASGTPVITTGHLGSACEWVLHGKNGMLTEFQPVDYMVYQLEIVRNAVQVLNDEKLHRKMIKNAANTKILSWDEVATAWNKMLRKLY